MSPSDRHSETAILGAARALLAEVGETFTMDQLEARAKVSRATIYRRIGNKAALLERLAQESGAVYEKPDVRLDILKAARAVFGQEGIAAATMEHIAAEADVGVATIYRHFGDKPSLIQVFIAEMTPFDNVRALTLHPTEDIRGDLEKIVEATLTFFYENRDIFRLVFMGGTTERHYLGGLRKRSDSTLASLSNYFQAQFAAGRMAQLGDTDELALGLMGMILAFAVIGPMHYDIKLEDIEHTAHLIVTLFLSDLERKKL